MAPAPAAIEQQSQQERRWVRDATISWRTVLPLALAARWPPIRRTALESRTTAALRSRIPTARELLTQSGWAAAQPTKKALRSRRLREIRLRVMKGNPAELSAMASIRTIAPV